MTVCMDASVVCAALFQEQHAAAAAALLSGRETLLAPELIHVEIANVIWKRHQRKEIDASEAADLLEDVLALPLEIIPADRLIEVALQLAIQSGRTVYDALYVALAMELKLVLVTADRRLVNALSATAVGASVSWIGEARWLPS